MPRARPKPSAPPIPTEWITTEAQEAGTETRLVSGAQGRAIYRRQRFPLFERMGRWRQDGRIRPELTKRQVIAAERLLDALCLTQMTPEKSGEYVDKSPDWSAVALHQAVRAFDLAALTACLPRASHAPVMALVGDQVHPGEDIDLVRQGLDAIADALRIR